MNRVPENKSAPQRLRQAITAIQQKVRRQLWVQGISNYLVLITGTVLLLGFVDFLIRFQDPSLRFTSTILFLVTATWGSAHFLRPTLVYRPTLVETAYHIETRVPDLRNRLSSALAFLDATQQTTDLQNAVIEETADMLHEININACVDTTGSRRTAIATFILVVPVTLGCLAYSQTSHLAMKRLLLPWSTTEWPRLHVLQFEDPPQQVAHGHDLELSLVDRNGALPSQVALQYRYVGDNSAQLHTETIHVKKSPAHFHLKNITQPVQFRATGGDDYTMDWSTVHVVDPPRIESFLLRLHPPAYTGWPSQPTDRTIRAVAGTRIEIGAYSNKPLMNVTLRSAAHDLPFDIWTHLDEERHVFVVPATSELPWTVKQTGTFWFELIDQTDIQGGEDTRFSVQAIPDTPPTATLTTTVEDLRVTTLAQLPLQVMIKEDLAVRDVFLQYHNNGSTHTEEKVYLQRGPSQVSKDAAERSLANLESGRSAADVRNISHTWNLASIPQLTAGDTLTCNAVATDYLPQQGQSTPIRLTIISIAELEQLLRLQRAEVLNELSKILDFQRALRQQLDVLTSTFGRTAKEPTTDIDELQRIELRQRQIAGQLNGNQGSVNARIETILQHIRINRIVNPETAKLLSQWQTGINEITVEELPAIRTLILTAIKTAAEENSGADTTSLLTQAQQHQASIIHSLTSIQNEFVQRENYLKLSVQLRHIMEQQTALRQATHQRERRLLENTSHSLSDSDGKEVNDLSRRQVNLVHRYQRLLVNMEHTYLATTTASSSEGSTLQAALRTGRRHKIDALLLASSVALRQNQVGRSSQQQQLALQRIQEVLQLLLQERPHQVLNTARAHQQLSQRLTQLTEQQQDVRNRLSTRVIDAPTALSTSQRILGGGARALGKRLEQSGITEPSATVSLAADQMQVVCDALDQAERSAANRAAEEAIRLLKQAEIELRQAFKNTPHLSATSWSTKLQGALRESHTKQSEILAQTRRLLTSYVRQHSWSEQQKSTLTTLLRSQRRLRTDTRAEQPSLLPVFSARLQNITNQMTQVAEYFKPTTSLEKLQSSESVQLQILNALAEIIAAVETDLTSADQTATTTATRPATKQARNATQRGGQTRSQLRLLQSWQRTVFKQTANLASRQQRYGKLSDLEIRQLEELAATQEQLGGLAILLGKDSITTAKQPVDASSTLDDAAARPQ
ncbi:MAG: hypothetical protein CMJ75_12425 [Planctomycetaceae bacterium]|nr:hypothetical protein [Planctomycetaceae bacterium]